ncbi:MAG: DUF6134 family protein [Woeseiaceae bacterium]
MNLGMKLTIGKTLFCLSMLTTISLQGFANPMKESDLKQWRFDVYLDEKPIGYHTFELERDGDTQVLTTEASFDVKILFITAFSYRHTNTEVWEEGCLASIDAATNNNGDNLKVRGSTSEASFQLESSAGFETLPSCVQTFAYWKQSILKSSRLLNSQTGDYERISVMLEGRDKISVAGQSVDALRYRLSAEAGDIKLWYSATDQTWLGLEAPAKGGRKIIYKAVAVPTTNLPQRLAAQSQ